MANSTDFIATVYDSLAKTLNAGGMSPGFVMQMAWPGYSLSPADFKAPDAPAGPYDADVAREAFSQLSNIAPTLHKAYFENSGFEIDDLYEILLASAIPAVAPGTDPMASPLNRMFSDALFELTQARRGYKNDPNRFYYPCMATPANWYDEASAPSWSSIEVKASEVKPPEAASPFVKAGGLQRVESGVVRLKPQAIDASKLAEALLESVDARGRLATQTFAPLTQVAPTKPLNAHIVAATRLQAGASPVLTRGAQSAALRAPGFQESLATTRISAALSTKSVPVNAYLQPELKIAVASGRLNAQTLLVEPPAPLALRNKLIFNELLLQKLPVTPVTPVTDGFSATFKFCKVGIDRPWLKLALLSSPNWRMFGTAAREYSTGTLDNNPGMFPLLPLAFIAVRDLRITANWSAADRANVGNAASFGFFDLKGGAFNQNTYEVKGLQIVAWVSRLTPALPPLAPA